MPSSFHVVHLVSTLGQGGAERLLCDLVRRDQRNRHTIIKLFAGRGIFDDEIARAAAFVHCLELPRSPLALLFLPVAVLKLLYLLRSLDPHVVVGWLYYGALAATSGRLLRKPVIWSFHAADFDLTTSFKKTTRSAIRLCRMLSPHIPSAIHYCSQASRAHHERLNFSIARALVIENGVDVDKLMGTIRNQSLMQFLGGVKFSHELDGKVIGCIARFEQQKDHRTLLAALARMRGAGRSCSLLLAGSGCDRDNPELLALISEFGLRGVVFPLGTIVDVGLMIHHCDVVALSSLDGEALPMALMETLALGKPVVATDIGSIAALVGSFGIVVPPRDPLALSRALEQVLWVDPQYAQAASEQAPVSMRRSYSICAAIQCWDDLYARTVELGASGAPPLKDGAVDRRGSRPDQWCA